MADVVIPDAPPVVDDRGRTLGTLFRTYLTRAGEALADVPGGPRGFQVLQLSAQQACTNQAGMASALGLDRTVMTYLVDDLEKAGLIERQPDPADRRARRVLLTAAGKKVLARAEHAIADVERGTLAALDDADAATLRALLSQAVAGLGHSVDACTAASAGEIPC